jgi:hypothetical protein
MIPLSFPAVGFNDPQGSLCVQENTPGKICQRSATFASFLTAALAPGITAPLSSRTNP